jgi:hypothetical protein
MEFSATPFLTPVAFTQESVAQVFLKEVFGIGEIFGITG